MRIRNLFIKICLLFILWISAGCGNGLNLPGNESGGGGNSAVEEGDNLLIVGVKSDIKDETKVGKSIQGEITPQNSEGKSSPWVTRSFTVVVRQIQLISAQLDANGFPVYDSNGVIQMNPNLPPVNLITNGTSSADLMDPTKLNSLLFLNNVTIPKQTVQNQTDRYNKLEVTVSDPVLTLDCSSAGESDTSSFRRMTVSDPSKIFIVKSISNTEPVGGSIGSSSSGKPEIPLAPQNSFTNRQNMDFGFGADNLIASNKFLINITEPLIFPNSGVVKLVMDPLGNTPGSGVDVHPNHYNGESLACGGGDGGSRSMWVVMPFGSARFENDFISTGIIPGSPYILEGTIMQVHDDPTDPNAVSSSQLPYPDPGPDYLWMQLQLNGSGGGLGGQQKPTLQEVRSQKSEVESQNQGENKTNLSDSSRNSLQPQSVYTTIPIRDLDIIAYSTKVPAPTYFYKNTGNIGSATWATKQTVDSGALPNATGVFGGIGLGDVDGDGDLDTVVGYKGGKIILYKNTGTGWAAGVQIASVGSDIAGVELANLDTDSDVDLITVDIGKRIRIFYNNGTGTFTAGPNFALTNIPSCLIVEQIDVDKFPDVLIGEQGGRIDWLQNDGNNDGIPLDFALRLVNSTAFAGATIRGVAVLDIDGDGYGDVAVGDASKKITILKNPSVPSPANFTLVKQITGPDIVTGGVERGDINNDTLPDIVAGFRGGKIYWYDNASGWTQNTVDVSIVSDVTDVEVGDVDSDSYMDIIAGYANQSIVYYKNNGTGGFTAGGTNKADTAVGGSVYLEIGDIDGDGRGDITPPAAITNLSLGVVGGTSVEIKWTAPGDDGAAGIATKYDIRYSTVPLDALNFLSALTIQATNEPLPKLAGGSESFVVAGLMEGTKYYFALETLDEAGNESSISNTVFTTTAVLPDSVPPAAVTNLAATEITSDSVTLTWTAVGDDGLQGNASRYDLRYSLSPIDGNNFTSANSVNTLPAPHVSGTSEKIIVSGLIHNATYYFVIKVIDNVGLVSPLSNEPQAATLNKVTDTVVTLGRPILIKIAGTSIITDYKNEPLSGSLSPYNQLATLAKRVDSSLIGTAIRVNGDLKIEPNPFSTGTFTIDPITIGQGGIFTLTPTHVQIIESPQSPDIPPPDDQSGNPNTFQTLSADNPTIVAAMTRLTDGPTITTQGEDARTKNQELKTEALSPQDGGGTNNPPPRPASISMVIKDMRIIQAGIESDGFPQFTGTITVSSSGVATVGTNFGVVKNLDGIHPDISLITNGTTRFELFNEVQFNNIFASITIPKDPCFTSSSPETCTRYNIIEVAYDRATMRIITTKGEVVNSSSSGSGSNNGSIYLRQQVKRPNNSTTTDLDDYAYADIGKFYIRITTPQIFPNSVNLLKIDPLGSASIFNMAESLNIDRSWHIYPMGIAKFEVSPNGMIIPGGPFTMEGMVVQQHDINNSANLPLPNTPSLSDFWIQLTEKDNAGNACNPLCDPVGTAGAPLLMRITDIGTGATIISDTLGNISPNIPGVIPTDEFRYLATKYDASINGTRVKVKGQVTLSPDPSGLAFGSLVIYPTQSIQVLDVAHPNP